MLDFIGLIVLVFVLDKVFKSLQYTKFASIAENIMTVILFTCFMISISGILFLIVGILEWSGIVVSGLHYTVLFILYYSFYEILAFDSRSKDVIDMNFNTFTCFKTYYFTSYGIFIILRLLLCHNPLFSIDILLVSLSLIMLPIIFGGVLVLLSYYFSLNN